MQALVKELEEVDKQREVVGLVKQACLDRVEGVIGGFKRVV